MKLEGEFTFNAPREKVWSILNDPAVLKKHMPGCESLEAVGDDQYEAVLKIGVGAIKGSYKAKLTLKDKNPPESYTLQIEGSGRPGFVKGEGRVHLKDLAGQTALSYSGELQVGGLIARVGQRLLGSISEKMTRQFFQDLGAEAEASQ